VWERPEASHLDLASVFISLFLFEEISPLQVPLRESVTYFELEGPQNTEETLRLAKEYAEKHNVRDVVVASTTGETGVRAAELFGRDFNLIVVTHMAGFRVPGEVELTPQHRRKIEELGGKVLVATHALSGVERAVRKKLGTILPVELMAHALRLFGEGTKVCVEIAVMAADAGLIPVDRDVLCIAGTGRGADTAVVIKPAHSSNFFDLRVKKIICKPL